MTQEDKLFRWRPHHIYCEQFLDIDLSDRGEEYSRVEQKMRRIMKSGSDDIIEFTKGVDELCLACPLRKDDRCNSPEGDEVEVLKWDGILMKGLGLSYGDRMSVREFEALTRKKSPLEFCRTRCKAKDICLVFELE
ncbi:MAG: DUF1284 domain-containing protein [Desulfatiglans sp.]|jgi:hypothetical protein|nr:DUF1284 domain-containing protein [Desulfatiglans sp.]